jgi:2,3-bisphosphoglycerate-independent phosphoglycerate mutase
MRSPRPLMQGTTVGHTQPVLQGRMIAYGSPWESNAYCGIMAGRVTPVQNISSEAHMRVLFIFLDGVGLGPADSRTNPFVTARMPHLRQLAGGQRLVAGVAPLHTQLASVVALDACLGVPGMPQSASGQAALLTGINVPAQIGQHYGPWPNQAIVNLLHNGNLFRAVRSAGKEAALIGAYPPSYFAAIQSGRRLYSVIPLAAVAAGLPLLTAEDLHAGRALAADLTGEGWRERLGLSDTPLLTPREAGMRMAALAAKLDFAFFEYWLSDYAGHGQDMAAAVGLLDKLDEMLGGLMAGWERVPDGLIVITSDHGNMEDLSTRGHTTNPVPGLLIGAPETRRRLAESLHGLPDVAPMILRVLSGD